MDVRVGLWRMLSTEELMLWTVVLEKTLESPLDWKGIQPVHSKEGHSWVFIGRTDAEAETPILWPPDAKSWPIGKDPDAGKDWGQEEKGMTEDEMVEWHQWLIGHEFGWTPGVGDGQEGLACCSPWGCKESDTTELLNGREMWNNNHILWIKNSIIYFGSDMWFAYIFPRSVVCLCISLIVFLCCAEAFSFDVVQLVYFCFCYLCFGCHPKLNHC